MSKIFVEEFEDNVLWPGNICYALYKRYPNGSRFFLGHFRAKYDYEAEVEWLDIHEKDPEPVYYIAKEVSDWKLENICDSAKYAEKLKARVKERWEAKQKANKKYQEWKAELVAKGMTEHDLPLSRRMAPPLLGEPTLTDMYYYCMFDDDMEAKWEAERKIARELADKAWQEELAREEWKKGVDGIVGVRPTTTKEGMYFQLRYLHNGKPVAKDSAINFAQSLAKR